MSTRANIIIKDQSDSLTFYRHSDGYPEGVAKTLGEFLRLIKNDRIRDNVEQASGWLILLGYEEYSQEPRGNNLEKMRANTKGTGLYGWKVGAYEPSVGIHCDIEYLYEIDLGKKTINAWEHNGEKKGKCVTVDLLYAIDTTAA